MFLNHMQQANIIAILQPGKDGTDASHYRPISLLSVVYKILELLILQRIQRLIDAAVPVSQAGFRKNRSIEHHFWLCQIHPTTMASNIGSYRST
jgi:hypothetical protein